MNELPASGEGGGWWGWSCRWGVMLEWKGLDLLRLFWVVQNMELLMVHGVGVKACIQCGVGTRSI